MKRGALALALRSVALLWFVAAGWRSTAAGAAFPGFQANDVVAFVGGEDMVEMHRLGYVELLLTRALPAQHLRFRGLGWEGDTVYEQPRELNFPKWPEQLKRAGATVVLCQFGQAEVLPDSTRPKPFIAAYERLLDTLMAQVPRVILLSPTPFEHVPGPRPDLSVQNPGLAKQVEAIRELAKRRGLTFVDLFNTPTALGKAVPQTRDGWHLNAAGQWSAARRIVEQLGIAPAVPHSLVPSPDGRLASADIEPLHQAIQAKTQLWFQYWRPENWAFLNGDRTEQPSSRDHRDPKIRWFPAEMEQYGPLIEAREREIAELAQRSPKVQ